MNRKLLFVYSGYPIPYCLFEPYGTENGATNLNDKIKTKCKGEDIPFDGNISRTLGNILARNVKYFVVITIFPKTQKVKTLTLLF